MVPVSVNENSDSLAWLEKADGMPVRIQGNCSFGRAATNQVVLADEREQAAHEALLDGIEKQSKAPAVWRREPVPAGDPGT